LEVFHPRLRMERATRRGVMRVIEPLFPCYLFVRCVGAQSLEQVRYMVGISGLVRFGQRAAVVPDAVIEELRQCFAGDEPMSVENCLEPGVEITVAEGTFLGYRGVVVRALPGRQRVQILLDFLGRATVAEVDRSSLIVEDRLMADLLAPLACSPGGYATGAY